MSKAVVIFGNNSPFQNQKKTKELLEKTYNSLLAFNIKKIRNKRLTIALSSLGGASFLALPLSPALFGIAAATSICAALILGLKNSQSTFKKKSIFLAAMVHFLLLRGGKLNKKENKTVQIIKNWGRQVDSIAFDGLGQKQAEKKLWKGFFKKIHLYFPSINHLSLKHLSGIRNCSFKRLKQLPIKNLDLSGSRISTQQLEKIAEIKSLKSLSLQFSPCLNEKGLEKLQKSPLETLNLTGSCLQTGDRYESNSLIKALREEQIPPSYTPSEKWQQKGLLDTKKIEPLKELKRLKSLTLSHFNDRSVRRVISKIPNLEELHIPYSTVLSGTELPILKEIKKIRIGFCPSLSPYILQSFVSKTAIQTFEFTFSLQKILDSKLGYASFLKTFKKRFVPVHPQPKKNSLKGIWKLKTR